MGINDLDHLEEVRRIFNNSKNSKDYFFKSARLLSKFFLNLPWLSLYFIIA